MGHNPQIEYIDMPAHLQGKYQYFTEATTDKLRATGYSKPFTTLEDAVHDYVRNYLVTGSVLGEETAAPASRPLPTFSATR